MVLENLDDTPYPCTELEDIRVRQQVFLSLFNRLDMSIINNPQSFMDVLEQYASQQKNLRDEKAIDKWIISLAKQSREELLPAWQFDWLKKTERACYYAWLHTVDSDQQASTRKVNPVKRLLSSISVSHAERYNAITTYFDCSPIETNQKIKYLESLKESWGNVSNAITCDWLDNLNKKDIENCKWTYTYIKKFMQERVLEGALEVYDLALENKPVNEDERYQAIYAMFDILDIRDKKDLKSKLGKALTQRKFRDKTKDLKRLNTYMTETTKSQLDELCDHYNKNIQDMIKQVIELSYQQMANDKKKEKSEISR